MNYDYDLDLGSAQHTFSLCFTFLLSLIKFPFISFSVMADI